jgi:geranylgeranyl pyrophosphate synthase
MPLPASPVEPRAASHEAVTLDEVLDAVRPGLQSVTDRLLARLTDPVARSVVYLITAGGKRLRPALVLLTGGSGPAPNQAALLEAAVAVELIHTATLLHDDIIDQSRLRRAQPTFHARWGVERALLMGDYLYATAFTAIAGLEAPFITALMADVCQQLCRGELREVEARFRLDLTEAEYLDIIRDKTASLIGGCCAAGAFLGGCDEPAVRRLTEFGIRFGLAFQIIDDCLDLTGDQRQLGKSIHADLDKGALSLPMIYLAQRLPPREREALFAPLRLPAGGSARAGQRATDPAFLARVAREAAASGAIAKAQARAAELAQSALAALDGTPMQGESPTYRRLAEYAIVRRS